MDEAEVIEAIDRALEEIRVFLRAQLGKSDVEDELEDVTENWMVAENDYVYGVPVTTELQRLLSRHHELCEELLDIRDERVRKRIRDERALKRK